MTRVAWVCGALFLLFVTSLSAEPPADSKARAYIIGFDDTEIEVLEDGEIDFRAVEDIGDPPLPILEDDGRGFVRVKARDGSMLWLGRSYLQTDEKTEVPTCHDARLAKASDRTMASARGVGEACK